MTKHSTPLLDQIETGPWPSFVSDVKREAQERQAAKCEYPDCGEPAEFHDNMDNKVCGECMCREIAYGAEGSDFEKIQENISEVEND